VRLSRALALPLCLAIAAGMTACFSAPPRREIPSTAPPPPPAERPPPPDSVPDMVPRNEPRSRNGNPPFYDVMGKRYFVLSSSVGYVERGVASWYGPGFHKVRTSTGEPYDMYAMTAAHKTLPLPAYVRVTNLQNGRSIVVRVNDRGPFVGNRIIDLSYTAASKLDMLRNGTAMVEVRTLEAAVVGAPLTAALAAPPPTPPVAAAPGAAPSAAPTAAPLIATPITGGCRAVA
jgi:rare lipoprotein A